VERVVFFMIFGSRGVYFETFVGELI
jgi:hypothetical protein